MQRTGIARPLIAMPLGGPRNAQVERRSRSYSSIDGNGGRQDSGLAFKLFAPVLAWMARRARAKGVKRELIERYCTQPSLACRLAQHAAGGADVNGARRG